MEVRTFLIADIRGYTRFTEEYGDEAAARLAAKFADIVGEAVEMRQGKIVEIRGDEALTVFKSARSAIRAAMDAQRLFAEETDADHDLPLRVGIGIDSGEAVELEDGSYRGNALNVAARLCAAAHGDEVLVSEGTSHLAGRLPGLKYVDRGGLTLKGIAGQTRTFRVGWEGEDLKKDGSSTFFFFGNSSPGRRSAGKMIALAILVAAVTAGAVVWLTTGDNDKSNAAGTPTQSGSQTSGGTPTDSTGEPVAPMELAPLVPSRLWADCQVQTVANEDAVETAVCQPSQTTGKFAPDRWEVSLYPDDKALMQVYNDDREIAQLGRNFGHCSRTSWVGEFPWEHGPGKPGGRVFCYFNGDDAVIVWVHEKLDQPTHQPILAIASEGGLDHARLFRWWNTRHHVIGKVE